MLNTKLQAYRIILASGSPRRQQFFKDLNIPFTIKLLPVKENYPSHLTRFEITNYLAQLKTSPYTDTLKTNDILITSDTIVWHNNKALGKPQSELDAFTMLKTLSNSKHEVYTSVCFKTLKKEIIVHDSTTVYFKALTDTEIWHYIKHYKPMDKAGAYGIQDWLGKIAVTQIKGSFFNVMGLPTHIVYQTLMNLV